MADKPGTRTVTWHTPEQKRITELESQLAELREAAQAVVEDGSDYDGRFIAVDEFVFNTLAKALEQESDDE